MTAHVAMHRAALAAVAHVRGLMRPASLPLVASLMMPLAVAVVGVAGCSKTVALDLVVVEACDQTNQALNGVSSFAVSTQGSQIEDTTTDDVVVFTADQGPQPLAVNLGDVTVTVKGFADDVSAGGAATTLPQAVGRTMPLPITEQSVDATTLVTVGQLDTFGRTTDASGACTELTADAPVRGRHGHTATFVPGLNKVLIYGGAVFGADGTESLLSTAELYDPATGTYERVDGTAGSRAYHAATALPDGRVIVSGGFGVISGSLVTLQTADIFDPQTGDLTTIQLKQARAHHTSTLMEGAGLVVLAGGCFGSGPADGCTPAQAGEGTRGPSTNLVTSIETFDINEGSATVAVPNANGLLEGRAFHQATSLENGANTILAVTGGANAEGPVCGIELFRADNGVLARVTNAGGINLQFPTDKCPVRHAAVGVDAQRLLVIGGQVQAPGGAPGGAGVADIFEFTTTAGLSPNTATLFNGAGRAGHQAATLADGSIIVVGGTTAAGGPTAEILARAPGTGALTPRTLAKPLPQTRDHGALAVLPTNQVLFTGGHTVTPPFVTSASAELYFGP